MVGRDLTADGLRQASRFVVLDVLKFSDIRVLRHLRYPVLRILYPGLRRHCGEEISDLVWFVPANILLDYRMNTGGEQHLQGDAFASNSLPEIQAAIQGTAALKRVVVVRDNQYIYSQAPEGTSFQLRYRETSLAPGEHYYYVRVEQMDRHMAWSSPIWVNYSGRLRQ